MLIVDDMLYRRVCGWSKKGDGHMRAGKYACSAIIGFWAFCTLVHCPTARADERPAVPADTALKAARASVREVLGLPAGPKLKIEDPQFAVKKLLDTGKGTENDPAGRYACFELALKIATDAKDPSMVLAAAGKIGDHFKVSPIKCKIDALTELARKVRTKDAAPAMAGAYEDLLAEAVDADDFDQANKAVIGAKRYAALAKDMVMLGRLRNEQRRLLAMRRASIAVGKANETLKTSPDDPEANETVGSYYCFVKGDWLRGLPMLAKCSDEAIMRAAKNELARPEAAEAKLAVGDAWWDLASKHRDKTAAASIKLHAGACYEEVLDELTGLQKAKYDKRIQASGIRGVAAGRFSASASVAAIARLRKREGLMLYWSFDRKTMIKKGNSGLIVNLAKPDGKKGLIHGTPKLVKGKVGDALEFEGKKSYIKMGFGSSGNAQATVMVWAKWSGKKSGGLQIFGIGSAGLSVDTKRSGWVGRVVDTPMGWKGRDAPAARLPKAGRWRHLAATYDGKTARFYVDGREVATRAVASKKWRSWHATAGGSERTESLFDGVVDEGYLFNKALTAAQIAEYHKATAGK